MFCKKIGYIISLPIANIIGFPFMYMFFVLLKLPGLEQLQNSLLILIVITTVEGILGAWLGLKVYKKLENKQVVKQISG